MYFIVGNNFDGLEEGRGKKDGFLEILFNRGFDCKIRSIYDRRYDVGVFSL